MRSVCWMIFLGMTALAAPLFAQSQEPAQPVAPVPASPAHPSVAHAATPASKDGKVQHSHAIDFLVIGTVFNEKALSFPGVQVRIRRSGEQKFRWSTYTNSRGDFAQRMPQGPQYEIVVQVKGFAGQTRTVETGKGETQERLSFRMELATGGKK